MPKSALAVQVEQAPSLDTEILPKITRLLSRAAFAFSAAAGAEQDGDPDSSSYAKQLALTGLASSGAAIEAYAKTTEYTDGDTGADITFPILESEAFRQGLACLATEVRQSATLGPAADRLADAIAGMLAGVPDDADIVAVHVDAAEQWLRAKPSKRAAR